MHHAHAHAQNAIKMFFIFLNNPQQHKLQVVCGQAAASRAHHHQEQLLQTSRPECTSGAAHQASVLGAGFQASD
jgi:hypothetical protein